jgi:hypothetical protein
MDDVAASFRISFEKLQSSVDRLPEKFMKQAEAYEYERARAVKWMRIPQITGTAASSALLMGAKEPGVWGPASGYVWCLRRIVIDGMTSGSTPDVVNLYLDGETATLPPVWQFNGNNFGYTFGKGELTMVAGQILVVASVGTFAATGTIRLTGELVEVPQERLGLYLS